MRRCCQAILLCFGCLASTVRCFTPGARWYDTDGQVIQAHGDGVLYYGGTYYWYGENKNGPTVHVNATWDNNLARVDLIGISCYSSTDLKTWTNRGVVLRADSSHPDLRPSKVLERPKVLYNPSTRQFVMWVHIEDPVYTVAKSGTAVAARPTGPFKYLGSFRPHDQMARDLTLFQDDDGSAYVVYSSEENAVMHVSALSSDFLSVEGPINRIMVWMYREAPAVFKHGPNYYMLTSGCTGWWPNRPEVWWASSMMGEWHNLGNPCSGSTVDDRLVTFKSQSTFVVPLPGRPGRFVYMGNQWNPDELSDSRYVWLPLWVDQGDHVPARYIDERSVWLDYTWVVLDPPTDYNPPAQVVLRWFDEWSLDDLDVGYPALTVAAAMPGRSRVRRPRRGRSSSVART